MRERERESGRARERGRQAGREGERERGRDARTHARTHNSTPGSMAGRPHKQRLGTRRCVAAGGLTCGAAANGWNSAAATGRSTPAVTLPQLPELLREAVGQQIDLDAPLMGTGISSRAALKLMGDLQRLADPLVSTSGQIASCFGSSEMTTLHASHIWHRAPLSFRPEYQGRLILHLVTNITKSPIPEARLGLS